jgi:hypothetical protein
LQGNPEDVQQDYGERKEQDEEDADRPGHPDRSRLPGPNRIPREVRPAK